MHRWDGWTLTDDRPQRPVPHAGGYYSTEARRFINRDTLLGNIGQGLTLNRYGYVNGNPVNRIDPSGLLAQVIPEAIFIGGVGCILTPGCMRALGDLGKGIAKAVRDFCASEDNSSSNGTAGSNGTSDTNSGDKPSLLDEKGERHVLDGDATGGGHRPGTGTPGKSEFPSNWSDGKITGEISDVATDPNSTRTAGRGGRTIVQGTRDGIDITVVVEPGSKGGRIVTGFPTNVPRNPK